jgi:hypothetical protein
VRAGLRGSEINGVLIEDATHGCVAALAEEIGLADGSVRERSLVRKASGEGGRELQLQEN